MSQIDDLKADFDLLDDWEDRYRHVIELGRDLPALDEQERVPANKVSGCASQVWITSRTEHHPGGPILHFRGDSDALIVKGLIAIIFGLYSGRPAHEIAGIDAQAILSTFGLKDHLTPQRSNGLAAMVARIKSDAAAAARGH